MSSDWQTTTLGDVLTLQRGIDLPTQDRKLGRYPVVASTGIVGYHNEAPVRGPGVVIGRSGSIGGGQYVKSDFWPLNTTLWVRDFKGNSPRFCYYLLKSMDLARLNAGSGVPTLNRNHLHTLPVLKPNLSVQDAITEVLGALDDRITLLRETNKTLEAIAQAIFKSWFVDFDPVKAKMDGRQPAGMDEETAALFPDELVESELGLIPKGWEKSSVGELLSRPPVSKRYTKKDVLSSGEHPVYEQGASILLGFHNDDPSCNASPEKPLFIFGDHTCVTKLSCEPFDISQNVILLEGSKRNSFWTFYAVQGKQTFQEYRRHWMELIAKTVVVPSPQLCDAFYMLALPIHLRVEANSRTIATLNNLRDTLLPRLISGKLRVPSDETETNEA
jgi:type I restriction enzyme, S subunit